MSQTVYEYECDGCASGYPMQEKECPDECHLCGGTSFTFMYEREVE